MRKITASLALALSLISTSIDLIAAEVGQPAPLFTLPGLQNGKPTELAAFSGKVIYLDFWASWCAPCRTSFPLLDELHKKLKTQGFEVIAVNLDEDKTNAEQFIKELPVGFTLLHDGQGEWADQYVVDSMPTSFIIDRHGVIQLIHNGFNSHDIKEIEQKVTSLLADK